MPKPDFSDVPASRRRIMKSIKSKDTKPEILLRKALWHKGYRYRKNYKVLAGSPDIALTKYRIAVFIDSEFFHGKDYAKLVERLRQGKRPEYWLSKIDANIKRDAENEANLRGAGYHVLRFWSEEVLKDTDGCVKAISDLIWDIKLQDMPDAITDYCEE